MCQNKELIKLLLTKAKEYYDNHNIEQTEIDDFNNYPHLFLLGCIMSSQIKYEQAFNIPYKIAEELKSKNIESFLSKNLTFYADLFKQLSIRQNDKKSKYFYNAIQRIKNCYNGSAANIWNDKPTSSDLVYRLLQFEGVGIKIATMVANILVRDYKIELEDMYSIDISPDIHVKRAMYRLGFLGNDFYKNNNLSNFSDIDNNFIIYKARSINPIFPGQIDLILWAIGQKKICQNNKCSEQCPFLEFCPKMVLPKS